MNRINSLFREKKSNILSVYFTAGYPELNDTVDIIRELDKSGVDMIEIGMPFSDPVADGPIIQRSSEKALENGMTINLLFKQLSAIREITDVPLILMGYFNPVFRYGIEDFLKRCRETGIDGTIIPDLPVEEYTKHYDSLFSENEIVNIFLVTPQSTDQRIRYLDSISKGFLYVVSTAATTGSKKEFDTIHLDYFRRLNDMGLKSVRLTGFGISNMVTFSQACEYSNGAIIGSAFINILEGEGNLSAKINKFTEMFRS
ncbi:MAG TPA: tryptophan synthase subunit alpha [Bacteroidales bacterium]|nr:tryptophan synthase subunit alpha [Bacteroidales bacterium]